MLNPWAIVQYAHNMVAAVVTGAFVMAAVGAYYTLTGRHQPIARLFLRLGVVAGLVASVLVAVTGDRTGQDGRRPSAGGPGRHGGPFRERSRAPGS